MVRVLIVFGLLFICALVSKPVSATSMSCAPSFRVLMECDETSCAKGFIVLITDGICEHPYRIEEATQQGLKKLYDEAGMSSMEIPASILDFSERENQENGVYEVSEKYVPFTVDEVPEKPKKTEFKSLEEAREFWLSEKFMSSVFSWFWFGLDAVIFFIALITLYLSVTHFKVKYLLRQETEKDPVGWQTFVWLCSWFFLIQLIGLDNMHLTALLFLIVPIIWIGEILALGVYGLRRKTREKQAGSPPARG